jgi:hypothetical protein
VAADCFAVANPASDDERGRLKELLAAVRVQVQDKTLTVVNRGTGEAIFSAAIDDIAGRTLTASRTPA